MEEKKSVLGLVMNFFKEEHHGLLTNAACLWNLQDKFSKHQNDTINYYLNLYFYKIYTTFLYILKFTSLYLPKNLTPLYITFLSKTPHTAIM